MSAISDIKNQLSIPDALDLLNIEQPARLPGHVFAPNREEQEPSLWVTDDHWMDFGTGEGGDVIDLVRYVTGGTLRQVLQFLASGTVLDGERTVREPPVREMQHYNQWILRNKIGPTDRRYADAIADARLLFDKYGGFVDLADLMKRSIVSVGRDNVFIPHYDEQGHVVGVKTRAIGGGQPGRKGAVTGSTFTHRLYRGYVTGDDLTKPAVLVEGESDWWAADRYFGTAAQIYALPAGAGVVRPLFIDELARHQFVRILTDNDPPGQTAAMKVKDMLFARPGERWGSRIVVDVPPEGCDFVEGLIEGWRPTV